MKTLTITHSTTIVRTVTMAVPDDVDDVALDDWFYEHSEQNAGELVESTWQLDDYRESPSPTHRPQTTGANR